MIKQLLYGLLALFLLHNAAVAQNTYYVNGSTGSDMNDGSQEHPFASIQYALDQTNNSLLSPDVVVVQQGEGNYRYWGGIIITKPVVLRAENNASFPTLRGGSAEANNALILVKSEGVTIDGLRFEMDFDPTSLIGIATDTENFSNLTIRNNYFYSNKPGSGYQSGSYAIKIGGTGATTGPGTVNIWHNTVDFSTERANFVYGIYVSGAGGSIGSPYASGDDITMELTNNITAYTALQVNNIGEFMTFEVRNNQFRGICNISGIGMITGTHRIELNTFLPPPDTAPANVPYLLRVNGGGALGDGTYISIYQNSFGDYTNTGLLVQRTNNVMVWGNYFGPLGDASNTNFTSFVFSTKETTTQVQAPITCTNLTVCTNTFRDNNLSSGGTAIKLYNHNGAANLPPLTNAKLGGDGSPFGPNAFSTALAAYIVLDDTAPTTSASVSGYGLLTPVTNVFPFSANIDAGYNQDKIFTFDATQTDTKTSSAADIAIFKTKIYDKEDNNSVGYVYVQPNARVVINDATDLAWALANAPAGSNIVLKTSLSALGNVTLDRNLSFTIDDPNATISINNFTVNGGAEVSFNNLIDIKGNFNLASGKIVAPQGIILDASKNISVTPASANYIDGKVYVNNVTADVLIPVGGNGKAAYIGLSGVTGTGTFTVDYYGATQPPNGLSVPSRNEYWQLNRSLGNASGKVTLYVFDDNTPIAPETAVYWGHNGDWENQGSSGSLISGADYYAITAAVVNTSFSPFTLGISNVLPVKLVSFSAKATNNGALLSWATATETNNAKFVVEKSTDGKAFSTIHIAPAKGMGSYTYTDASFHKVAYYRLSQVDIDGKVTRYDDLVRFVKFGNEIVLYPNPVGDVLHIKTDGMPTVVRIANTTGAEIFKGQYHHTSIVDIDFKSQKSGIYFVKIEQNNSSSTYKVAKK